MAISLILCIRSMTNDHNYISVNNYLNPVNCFISIFFHPVPVSSKFPSLPPVFGLTTLSFINYNTLECKAIKFGQHTLIIILVAHLFKGERYKNLASYAAFQRTSQHVSVSLAMNT